MNFACYSYTPVAAPFAPAPVGDRVRVQLTPEGVSDLTRYLGPRVSEAEGTLNSIRDDGAIVVGVDWVQTRDGGRQAWNGEGTVAFPKTDVASIDRRAFDARRSMIAAIALTAGVVALAVAALKSGGAGGGTGLGSGGPPP